MRKGESAREAGVTTRHSGLAACWMGSCTFVSLVVDAFGLTTKDTKVHEGKLNV
jgi:hypothetical protein